MKRFISRLRHNSFRGRFFASRRCRSTSMVRHTAGRPLSGCRGRWQGSRCRVVPLHAGLRTCGRRYSGACRVAAPCMARVRNRHTAHSDTPAPTFGRGIPGHITLRTTGKSGRAALQTIGIPHLPANRRGVSDALRSPQMTISSGKGSATAGCIYYFFRNKYADLLHQ